MTDQLKRKDLLPLTSFYIPTQSNTMFKLQIFFLLTIGGLLCLAQPNANLLTFPDVHLPLSDGNYFDGLLRIASLAVDQGGLLGTVFLDGNTTSGYDINGIYEAPYIFLHSVANGAKRSALDTCSILDLTLGPLDLHLLGLNVFLDQVTLDITATSGPGNLLGNLLCSVTHLLDGTGLDLSAIGNLLRRINTILSGL